MKNLDRVTVSLPKGMKSWLKRVGLEGDTNTSQWVRGAIECRAFGDHNDGKLSDSLLGEFNGIKTAHGIQVFR
jgi:hypothetical protein